MTGCICATACLIHPLKQENWFSGLPSNTLDNTSIRASYRYTVWGLNNQISAHIFCSGCTFARHILFNNTWLICKRVLGHNVCITNMLRKLSNQEFQDISKALYRCAQPKCGKNHYSTSWMLWSQELLFGIDNWDIYSIDFVLKIKLSVFRLLWSCKYYFW